MQGIGRLKDTDTCCLANFDAMKIGLQVAFGTGA